MLSSTARACLSLCSEADLGASPRPEDYGASPRAEPCEGGSDAGAGADAPASPAGSWAFVGRGGDGGAGAEAAAAAADERAVDAVLDIMAPSDALHQVARVFLACSPSMF